MTANSPSTESVKQPQWEKSITAHAIDLHQLIWENRNSFVHGKMTHEAQEKL